MIKVNTLKLHKYVIKYIDIFKLGDKINYDVYEEEWEDTYLGDCDNIMVHLSYIREKVEENPKNPVYFFLYSQLFQ